VRELKTDVARFTSDVANLLDTQIFQRKLCPPPVHEFLSRDYSIIQVFFGQGAEAVILAVPHEPYLRLDPDFIRFYEFMPGDETLITVTKAKREIRRKEVKGE